MRSSGLRALPVPKTLVVPGDVVFGDQIQSPVNVPLVSVPLR